MTTVMCFVVFSGAGAALRWLAVDTWPGGYRGTLAVNVIGSLALGLLGTWTGPGFTVVGTGVLGSLTTFSAFASDTADLVEGDPSRSHAVGYVVATLTFGIGAAWLGLAISG